MVNYSNKVMQLGLTILELLSEALGLHPDHLKYMGCAEGLYFICNYYTVCPEPSLKLGINNHTDIAFFSILLHDQLGGLQVLHEDQWFDVTPISGALVINLEDMSQAAFFYFYIEFRCCN